MATSLVEDLLAPLPDPRPGVGPLGLRVLDGSGPPLVLIHGLGRAGSAWGPVLQRLRGGPTLLVPDNPGFGPSRALRVPLTIAAHARLHAATLRACGVPPPWAIVGLSLGGMIALALAAELGSDCSALAVLSSSARETGFWRLSPAALLRTTGRLLRHPGKSRAVVLPELYRPSVIAENPGLTAALDTLLAAEGFSVWASVRQVVAAARFRMQPYEDRLPARRLVAVGSADRFVPPRHSLRIAARLGVEPIVLEGRGHDLPVDDPDATAALLAGFIAADGARLRP